MLPHHSQNLIFPRRLRTSRQPPLKTCTSKRYRNYVCMSPKCAIKYHKNTRSLLASKYFTYTAAPYHHNTYKTSPSHVVSRHLANYPWIHAPQYSTVVTCIYVQSEQSNTRKITTLRSHLITSLIPPRHLTTPLTTSHLHMSSRTILEDMYTSDFYRSNVHMCPKRAIKY